MRPSTFPLSFPTLALAATLGGCGNQPDQRSQDTASPVDAVAVTDPAEQPAEQSEAPAAVAAMKLQRGLHHAEMTEVVTDVRGKAALTLDADGGVRLWPRLLGEEVGEPWVVPIRDPASMSIAATEDGFVLGFVDTVGGAKVARVRRWGDQARWSIAFERSATDPLLELHVLDGGQRIVGLGIDHRVELWDHEGRSLSAIDEPGFVPWQLRIGESGGTTTMVAVLANPVRVHPITLRDGRLELGATAHPVAIDRGPNRNDLTLSSDNNSILVLRRLERRSKRFSLERIDLTTGERHIVSFESEIRTRPRLHPCSGDRVLIELGNGKASWLDLTAAVPKTADLDLDTTSQPLMPFDLAASSDGRSVHALVVANNRIVPTTDGLLVDALDQPGHRVLGNRGFAPTSAALSADGSQVAWSTEQGLLLEPVDGSEAPTKIWEPDGSTDLMAFVGGNILVVMRADGEVSLRDIEQGTVLARRKMPFEWGIANVGWRTGANSGQLVLSSLKPGEPVHVLPVTEHAFGELQDVPRSEQASWPEAGRPRRASSREWTEALGYAFDDLDLRPADVLGAPPDPTGRAVEFVQSAGDGRSVVTLWDDAEHRRRFTVAVPAFADLAWSANGERLAIAHGEGGWVLDAATGRSVLERRDLGLAVADAAVGDPP